MKREFLYFENGVPVRLLNEADVLTLLAVEVKPNPVIPGPIKPGPVEPTRVFGWPRTLVGNRDGLPVFQSPATPGLLLRVSEFPDAFVPKGANMEYTLLPGVQKPVGEETANYGQSAPSGFVRPDGYRIKYFGNKKDEPYYELSDLPDEMPDQTTTRPTIPIATTDTHSNEEFQGTISTK